MERNVDYYLTKTVEELKDVELKKEILYNENHYIFVWFCQDASEEQLKALLDDKGIDLLASTDSLRDKLNGLLTSGNQMNFFENEKLCQMVLNNNAIEYTYSLNHEAALSFAKYVYENDREKIIGVFSRYDTDNQIQILNNMVFNLDEKRILLNRCKKETAEFMLDKYSLDLAEMRIETIENLAVLKVVIPASKMTPKLIKKIANIGDVNRYRILMNYLEEENDVSQIEAVRRKIYEKELSSIGEDGLLEKFRVLKEKVESKTLSLDMHDEVEGIEGFVGSNAIYKVMFSREKEEIIRRLNDYYISNIIVDYFLKDIPTNAIKNIDTMLKYNDENTFLTEEDEKIYKMFQSIDSFDVKHKLMLFDILKGENMEAKFYDDFSKAKEAMVEQFNSSVLNEETAKEFLDEIATQQIGVPIYYLTGQPFKCLVRNIGVYKNRILEDDNLDFRTDGSSFSIDGSDLLQVFGDNDKCYTLAYSKIPEKQLIHMFPTDSFSRYDRAYPHDVPKNKNATDRVIKLYTPDDFTRAGREYNEVIISVPNCKKHNEFEEKLDKPKPFAIYCYDKIYDTDVESAKQLGIGIIVIDTKCYNIDRSNRISMHDTIGNDRKLHSYVEIYNSDERWEDRW